MAEDIPESNESAPRVFAWHELADVLAPLVERFSLERAEDGLSVEGISTDEGLRCQVRLPLMYRMDPEQTQIDSLFGVPPPLGTHVILLIQAGAASLGLCEGTELVAHKVIKRYMVRKSRGKAQLTYLKTRGKSRYGSRLRLQNTVKFFADINLKLTEWGAEVERARAVYYSAPVRLWTELFKASPPPPFVRRDPRLKKIPLDIRRPDYKQMKYVSHLLTHGEVRIEVTD